MQTKIFYKALITFCSTLLLHLPLCAASDTFMDYQNYNHGYCPDCNCYPCRCGEGVPFDDDPDDPPDEEEAPCSDCEKPDPCDPAPVCGTNCGISLCLVGLVVGGVAAAGAIIIGASSGSKAQH